MTTRKTTAAEAARNNETAANDTTDGIFVIKSANQAMADAKNSPDPQPLWLSLWNEGEICCLFADSGVGKSIYAVQIATAIAKEQKVLYFDFELTEKQFQIRYTDDKGKAYKFPDNLYRVEAAPERMSTENIEAEIINGIENLAIKYQTKVLIIDNLSWLCNAAEDGELAGKLMKQLMTLKRKYGWSILVLSHTPKRDTTKPITQNDLAGSKRIINFIDSAFSIGFSLYGESHRYIKEIKTRLGKTTYGANNVINAIIEKENNFLYLRTIGCGGESEHLQMPKLNREMSNTKTDKLQTAFASILTNDKNGMPYNELVRAIVKQLNYKSDKSGKNAIESAIKSGIIYKNDNGKYCCK